MLERISDVTYKIAKEPVKEDRWQIVHYNRLKPYIAEAERPRRRISQAKQTVYDENTDSEATESEEDTKHETGEPRGNLTERQISKDDSVSQSPAKGLCLEIPANPFGSLCLGDSITKRLRAHEVADDCVIRGFSGIKIDELRRRLKQSRRNEDTSGERCALERTTYCQVRQHRNPCGIRTKNCWMTCCSSSSHQNLLSVLCLPSKVRLFNTTTW